VFLYIVRKDEYYKHFMHSNKIPDEVKEKLDIIYKIWGISISILNNFVVKNPIAQNLS